ncbi:flagellar filament capping protein FliD [Shewanella decolorationis]|uniref:Flagellar hook-associated protein 2 n=1 Tax=Shewanella decolorationis TaxID=256839 RepID=A0A5B8QVK0_9GAMM|nr:flagellar filament capping protein FliD [Shewanella decolorationis]QDZ90345.1 flagellar filament capping protein FliD [Shewanella decolorationis]
MAGLTASGIGSGLDIGGIVSALVNAEKAPKEAQFNKTEGLVNTQISALGALKSSISDFLDKLKPLSEAKTFTGFTSKLSKSDYLSAKTDSDAVAGSYNLVVEQLAQSQKVGSANVTDVTAPIGSGSLAIDVAGKSFSIDVASGDSLQDIVKKINKADDNVGVTATIINSDAGPQMVLTSNKTGTANQIQVTANDDTGTALADTFTMTEVQGAKDAILYVDGLKVTSNSNEVKDAIQGVTLTLKDADVDKSTTLTIEQDKASATKAIKEFVESYNTMTSTVKGMSGYDPKTKQVGIFQGDSLIRSLQSQFRGVISSSYGNGMALANLGIKTTRDGTLELDEDTLKKALENDISAVADFFTTEGTGFAAKMTSVGEAYTQSGGLLDSRDETLDNRLSRLGDERAAFALKMKAYEARLTKQFNAMDLMVGQLNSQGSTIQARIDSLPGLVSNKK